MAFHFAKFEQCQRQNLEIGIETQMAYWFWVKICKDIHNTNVHNQPKTSFPVEKQKHIYGIDMLLYLIKINKIYNFQSQKQVAQFATMND